MGLNFIPKYPELSPTEPATAREPIEDIFSRDALFSLDDGATGEGDIALQRERVPMELSGVSSRSHLETCCCTVTQAMKEVRPCSIGL